MAQKNKFLFDRPENIVVKGENTGNQHFLLFPQCFQKAPSSGFEKFGIVWYRFKLHITECAISVVPISTNLAFIYPSHAMPGWFC